MSTNQTLTFEYLSLLVVGHSRELAFYHEQVAVVKSKLVSNFEAVLMTKVTPRMVC